MGPKLTVLLPIKGFQPDMLRQAVESLVQQSEKNFTVLLLCASDAEPVRRTISDLIDERFDIVQCEQTDTLTEQLNRGLNLATTDWIARADADDVNETWRFERQLDYLKSNPQVGVLGTAMQIIDSQGRVIGRRGYPTDHGRIVRTMHQKNGMAHPTVVFRKEAVLSVGGYQNPGQPAQDYDLWSRMIQEQFVFANLAEPTVRYRLHDSSTKSRKQKETIRSTLRIKKQYWRPTMKFQDRLRMALEWLLLWIPSNWVSVLFARLEFRNSIHKDSRQ